MITLKMQDESLGKQILNEFQIDFQEVATTVKEIIEKRVEKEVTDYNDKLLVYRNGLINFSKTEKNSNASEIKRQSLQDIEKHILLALAGFQQNKFFVLINDKQANSLTDKVIINSNTVVSFLKLTPLIGG